MQLVFIGTHNECVDTIMCTCNRDKSHIRPYDSEFVIIDICLCKHFVCLSNDVTVIGQPN